MEMELLCSESIFIAVPITDSIMTILACIFSTYSYAQAVMRWMVSEPHTVDESGLGETTLTLALGDRRFS